MSEELEQTIIDQLELGRAISIVPTDYLGKDLGGQVMVTIRHMKGPEYIEERATVSRIPNGHWLNYTIMQCIRKLDAVLGVDA